MANQHAATAAVNAAEIALLRELADNAPVGFLVFDAAGRVHYLNRRFCELWGLDPGLAAQVLDYAELTALCAARVTDRQALDRACVALSEDGGAEREVELCDGRWLRLFGAATDGRLLRLCLVEDVTAHVSSEQRLQAYFDGARDAIITADRASGRIIEANRQAEHLLGYSRSELLGMHQSELHPPELRAQYREQFQRYRDGTAFAVRAEVATRDGRRVPTEISASVIELADGRSALQGIFRDVSEQEKARRAESERAQFYRQVFQSSSAVKLLIDPSRGVIVDANAAAARFYGYQVETLRGMPVRQINTLPEDRLHGALGAASGGKQLTFQFRHRLASGEQREVEVHSGPVTINGHQYLYSIIQDVTERYRQEALQRERGRILELIARDQPLDDTLAEICRTVERHAEDARSVILLLGEDGRLQVGAMPSLPPALRQRLEGLTPPCDGGLCDASTVAEPVIRQDLRQDPFWQANAALAEAARLEAGCALAIRDKQGRSIGALTTYYLAQRSPEPAELALMEEMAQLASVAVEQQQLAGRLVWQAQHDELTGLPNRNLLNDRLDRAMQQAQREGGMVAVMLLDLDDFKVINDSLGHSAGDRLLEVVARRLEHSVREGDTVARLGGDEFVLVLNLRRAADAEVVAEKVRAALSDQVELGERELYLFPSIGISLYPQDGTSAEVLLQAADTAMYAAKYAGKNRYHYFAETLNLQVTERLTLETELRQALAQQQFELFFQPRIGLDDGRTVGAEALLRWHHPQRGLLTPGSFLGVAEQSRLIHEIDRWVFRAACRQAARWQAEGLDLVLSVNLSAGELHAEGMARRLAAVLREEGLAPERLEVEITESMLMHDITRATEQLVELKRLAPGLRVAIDDFGSGYSSLNYLRHLPLDTLKIDRAFVRDLASEDARGSAFAIVKTIVDLGRNLGLNVLAEGVETAVEARCLKALGCHEVQGFYYSRPLPLAALRQRLLAPAP